MLNFELIDNKKDKYMILFHGIGGDLTTWDLQEKEFSQTHNLLLIDLPAHGKSSYDNEYISISGLNKDIKEVLDYTHITIADFVGLSLGSIVMGNFILSYPQYVNKAVFVASAIELNWFCKAIINFGYIFRKVLPYKPIYEFAIGAVAPQGKYKSDRRLYASGFDRAGRKNLMHWLEYTKETSCRRKVRQDLNKLNKPMLFISGKNDIFFISGSMKTARAIKTSEIIILQNSMHVCNRDEVKEFNCKVSEFLEKKHS